MPCPLVLKGGEVFPIATANDGSGRIIECVVKCVSSYHPLPRSQSRETWMRGMSGEREREAGNDDGQSVDECPRSFDRPL
jgi:hypothetical protein